MTKEGTSNSKVVGANWNKLKTKVAANPSSKKKAAETVEAGESIDPSAKLSAKIKATYVGLDCEMVGIGPSGTQSALARCCLVDFDGEVIYDEFVRPPGFVTDFRTKWSGVRKKDLRQGAAISLQEVLYAFLIIVVVWVPVCFCYRILTHLNYTVPNRCSEHTKGQSAGGSRSKERFGRIDVIPPAHHDQRHRHLQALHESKLSRSTILYVCI